MNRRSLLTLCWFFGCAGSATRAGAAGPPSPDNTPHPARLAREYRVEFAADRLEVDGELGSLQLDGKVRVQAQRYRLKSEHLQLTRGPRGVQAEGAADVAFCTCDDPPLKLRVSRATLAPPTDALFSNVKLELWDVPVLWLPGLWLRAPTRLGLTLPHISYRAQDGLYLGAGAYVPLDIEDGRVSTSLSVSAGVYAPHGSRLEAEIDTETSSSRVAWDHVTHSALEVDAHGSAALSEATFGYRVDALRGLRAPVESSSLEVAARRTDRLRVSVSHVDELALGVGVRADAPRAGSLRDLGAIGPELYVGASSAIGGSGAYDTFATARTTVSAGNKAETLLFERAMLTENARPGPLGIALTAAQSAALDTAEQTSSAGLQGGLQVRVGLPLLRHFGSLTHFLEPVVVARGRLDEARQDSVNAGQRVLVAAGGVDTSLGQRASRQAISVSLRVGELDRSGQSGPVGALRTTADTRVIGVSQSFALLGQTLSRVSLTRLRLGPTDGLHLLAHADGAGHGSPAQARLLFDESWFDPARAFLDRDGWSGGSELSVPWTRSLSSSAAVDYDLTSRVLLASWLGFGYRHPCGCLAVAGFVGRRFGREGVDAWIGFDLAP